MTNPDGTPKTDTDEMESVGSRYYIVTYPQVEYSEDTVNAGDKEVTVTFDSDYYDGCDQTLTYYIKPVTEYTLTLGESLKMSEIAGSSGEFSIGSTYTKSSGYYKFALSTGKKKITTYTYSSSKKVNYSKMKKVIKVTWSGDKKETIKVTLKLPTPAIKVWRKKINGVYRVYFKYDFTNATDVKIRIKELPVIDDSFDNYTKTHKKSNSTTYVKISPATFKKLNDKMTFYVKVTYNNLTSDVTFEQSF